MHSVQCTYPASFLLMWVLSGYKLYLSHPCPTLVEVEKPSLNLVCLPFLYQLRVLSIVTSSPSLFLTGITAVLFSPEQRPTSTLCFPLSLTTHRSCDRDADGSKASEVSRVLKHVTRLNGWLSFLLNIFRGLWQFCMTWSDIFQITWAGHTPQ